MYQTMVQRYENGCVMLMNRRDEHFHFLSTAFIVHSQGYLLTTSHTLRDSENLVAVQSAQPGEFSTLSLDNADSIPVKIVQQDEARDIALLKMELESDIEMPDDFIGSSDDLMEGAYVLTFGVSFGHLRIHNIMIMHGILSAKLISLNETKLLVFDQSIHPGSTGGPLVNTEDGRIVGILQGIFNPLQVTHQEVPEDYYMPSHFSYAVSIEYAKPLMEAEGLV